MKWLNKLLSFKADLMVTLLNGLIVIVGIFILNGLIARMYGLEVLGEFLLIKRTLYSFVGILLIGMSAGLPNFLSRDFDKSYGDNAFIIFILFTIPLTVLFIYGIFRFNISGFNNDKFWVYFIFSLGISAQFITYALYRGYMNMIGANIFQLLGTAIIPLIVFTSIDNLNNGLFWIGVSVLIIMIIAFLIRNNGFNVSVINFTKIKQIFKYGFVRVPSFISQFILLAGIPIFIAQSEKFEDVAYFNSSLSLVRLSLIFINPIGMVLLPRISNKISSGDKGDISETLNLLFKAGIVFSIIGTTYCFINAPLILKLWLGEINNNGVAILRFVILALPFYTFAGLTRSPLDAISERGYNSIIYGLAAISMVIIIFIGIILEKDLLITALYSFIVSHIIAGIVSAYYIQKLYNQWFLRIRILRDSIFCISSMIVISKMISILNIPQFSQFIISSMIFLLLGIFIIYYSKTGWVAQIKSIFNAQ
jgi:O-antigen/teichoic acid export membrane protein|tara:strand:- start:3011 stop:4447 length:1437 start_codon:yes stop_codon:yes gene_type:complete